MGGYLWLWALRITYQMHKSCEMCLIFCVVRDPAKWSYYTVWSSTSIVCAFTFVLEVWAFLQWANNPIASILGENLSFKQTKQDKKTDSFPSNSKKQMI